MTPALILRSVGAKKAAEIDSTHFRVEFNGELYNIAAVDHMNFRRKSIKLSCEKVRR